MTINLHPKIAALVQKEIARSWENDADLIVNEILWNALREGDVSGHYATEDLLAPDPRE